MKKFLISILIGIGLILPSLVLGAVGYVRTPSGFTIQNPVSFAVSGVFDEYPERPSWRLQLLYSDGQFNIPINSNCYTTNNGTWTDSFPLTGEPPVVEYVGVKLYAFDEENCAGGIIEVWLEWDNYSEIFEIVEEEPPPPEANWFFGSGLVAGLKDVVGEIFGDIGILLAIIIGLPLAFWLTHRVIGLIRLR